MKKEVFYYLVFGALTTLINIACFWFTGLFIKNILVCNTIAWIISVLFAFFTNRKYVFKSSGKIVHEMPKFFAGRIFSLLVDNASIYLMVNILNIDKMISKIVANIIVVIINYIISKFLIFKKEPK